MIPVICWKMKNTQTTTSARRTPGVQAAPLLPVPAFDPLHHLRGALNVVLAGISRAERAHALAPAPAAVPRQPAG